MGCNVGAMTRLKVVGAVLGLALVGTAIGLRSRRRSRLGDVQNRDRAHPAIVPELDDAEQRARAAGARDRRLTYIGAGAEGITFCDDAGQAYKVGRHKSSLAPEAEWLKTASTISAIKQHVPRGVRFDKNNNVIVRECLVARESERRPNEKRVWGTFHRITKAMEPYGYGRPEYKPDSLVMVRGRGPVLVDAGFAVRRGHPLTRDALDVINGRKKLSSIDITSLAWEIRMERGSTIPEPVANKLLKRLKALDPAVEL